MKEASSTQIRYFTTRVKTFIVPSTPKERRDLLTFEIEVHDTIQKNTYMSLNI